MLVRTALPDVSWLIICALESFAKISNICDAKSRTQKRADMEGFVVHSIA